MLNQDSWSLATQDLVLANDEVHVWRASVEQSPALGHQLAQTLSADEHLRAGRFYFERDRHQFIVGRGLLRTILGRYLDIPPQALQFCYGPRGKPALENLGDRQTLQFNLSHSQGLALYAVTRDRHVGIDLEYLRPLANVEKLAQRFFSTHEHAVIHALPPDQQQAAFFRGWTCKEAYLKAIGAGLAQLEQVEVSLALEEPARLLKSGNVASAPADWSLQTLNLATNYAAALAVEGHNWRLSCGEWSTE